ncbi:MAG: hypothetical protein G01um101438_893 [Parcubacteria group bacterium Gr01-1014_38]|nr:MAG: hypothetical protein G01um101438_893 [Parcubacteria group bacterium Gr01-1014_38]
MPSLSELPSDVNRERFVRVLQSLGFQISKKGGSGSHYKATWPQTRKMVIVQYKLRKDVLYELLKEIKKISGVEWEQIKERL